MKAIELAESFGYLTKAEVLALAASAKSLSIPKNLQHQPLIVQVGAGAGTSSLAMAEARPDAIIISIDVSPGGPLGGHSGERNAFEGTGLRLPYQLLGDSASIGKFWKQMADMVLVDGDHSEAGVRGDLVWFNALRSGGLMAFHDYGSPRWPAVKAVVDEFISNLRARGTPVEIFRHVDYLLVLRIG